MTAIRNRCKTKRSPTKKTVLSIAIGVMLGAWLSYGQLANGPAGAQTDSAPPDSPANASARHPYALRVPAPSLDGGEWVNVEKPLTLADLRGRFVLLGFLDLLLHQLHARAAGAEEAGARVSE